MSKRARPVDADKDEVRQVAARIGAATTPGERRKQLAEAKKDKQAAFKQVGISLTAMKKLWSALEVGALHVLAEEFPRVITTYKNAAETELTVMRGDM